MLRTLKEQYPDGDWTTLADDTATEGEVTFEFCKVRHLRQHICIRNMCTDGIRVMFSSVQLSQHVHSRSWLKAIVLPSPR